MDGGNRRGQDPARLAGPLFSRDPSRRTRFIYDFSPSFRFNRSWRLTLDASRRFYATTPRTLAQTTHVDEQSAQLVWTPDSRSRLSLRLYHRILSPQFRLPTVGSFTARRFQKKGNGGAARAVRTVWKTDRAELALGYEGNVYGYSHPDGLPTPEFFANPGFFAPGFYQRHAGLVQPTLKPADFFAWRLYGTFGFQQIGQGSERGFSSTAGTELEFRLSERTALSLGYDYFNVASAGRQIASAGKALSYHSNSVTAGLRYRF